MNRLKRLNRFNLKFGLSLGIVVVLAVVSWQLFMNDRLTAGIWCLLLFDGAAYWHWRLCRRIIRGTTSFVSALESNDGSARFDFLDEDRELRYAADGMNRLLATRQEDLREIENAKLYYGRILQVMTHEMRNGITPVLALSTDICQSPAKYGQGELAEAMTLIKKESENISRFLDSYYNLTHIPEPNMVMTDAAEFFKSIKSKADIEARQRSLDPAVCRFSVASGTRLMIDPGLLGMAVVNLIRNALDAVADRENPLVEVTLLKKENGVELSVADNGEGLSREARENLFQPFFTTKQRGSGVGLCLSFQIARTHGGALTLRSVEEHGTVATLHLPASCG